jgi:phage shock protein PspC (stress-responsive transcriptional regulator)
MLLYILEIITLLTVIGTICYLTEKFIMESESEHNNS